MQKRTTIIVLAMVLVLTLLLSPGPAMSQVGQAELANCSQLAFSTEEDFMSGETYISDGDLLGIITDASGARQCEICARNADLVGVFDVTQDLGLDAADVLDVAAYQVAFSTELDSPHNSPTSIHFTAGDLLITHVTIIPNEALTYKFSVGYDIGLDAVHFVGSQEDIKGFLNEAQGAARSDWLEALDRLSGMLEQWGIDIWFSTEGTLRPVSDPGFLDGDLLSARTGTIVATNAMLLPDPEVPAGLPKRGVDFGLDAVTSDRSGERLQINLSTEILFESDEIQFTDGDILRFGNGVAATNWDLIQCFQPAARELGLDALSVGRPEAPPCVSRITDIGGVDIADISPVDGMAFPGTVGSINAPVPFGGLIDIRGTICDDVAKYRVLYRENGSGNPWQPIPVLIGSNWKVKVDAIFPWGPDCLGHQAWYSDADGWYSGPSYRHLSESGLGGCNPGLALTVWNSAGKEELYDLVLETETTAGAVVSDTERLVQLDNTAPAAALEKVAGECNIVESMPLMVKGAMDDPHFHQYRLQITGDSYGLYTYPAIAYYDDATDNIVETGTSGYPTNVDLHEVTVYDLDPNPTPCGYTVLLRAWDRTMVCNFKFPTNQAYYCPGCRHSDDAWTFNYDPGTP